MNPHDDYNGGPPSLDQRVAILEAAREHDDAERLIVEARRDKKIDEIKSIVTVMAVRVGRIDGEREVTVSDMRDLRRRVVELESSGQSPYRVSQHDLEDTQRRAIVSAEQAAKIEADRLRLELEHEARLKAEKAIEKREDRAHGWKHLGVEKALAGAGALIVLLITALVWLATHPNPWVH